MRRFLWKSLLVALPFLAYGGVVAIVDPYDFLNVSGLIADDIKLKTSYQLNPCLWKMIEFRRRPYSNLLLGDSRMGELEADLVGRVAGEPYYNFSYGGTSLNEMIDTFWFAASVTKLKNVYAGVNFDLYSDYKYSARTDSYRSLDKAPLLYFTNRTVIKAAYYAVDYRLSGVDPQFGVVTVARDEYWRDQIATLAARWYSNYVYPARYHKELVRIAEYCRKNGVRLRFIVLPSHVEFQRRVHDFGLDEAYRTFKTDLGAIATTCDFDLPNEITNNRDNFRDPLHFVPAVRDTLIQQIWAADRGDCGAPR